MRRTLAFAIFVVGCSLQVEAQTPSTTRLVPYSGTIRDVAGVPLNGDVSVTFELHEHSEGGAPLWSETQRVNANEGGRYLVYLGSVTPLPQAAFTAERARWLGVSVDGRELPRVMLVAVPYALRAIDADTLGGQPASSFVRSRPDGRLETSAGLVIGAPLIDGSGNTNSLAKFDSPTTVTSAAIAEVGGRVGFGIADPTGGGVVDSVFTIRNLDNNTGFGILNETHQRRFAINTLASGGWSMYDGGSGVWNRGLTQVNGRLAVGVTAPNALVEVLQTGGGFAPPAGLFRVDNTNSVAPAVQGRVNSIFGNSTATAIHGLSEGTGGYAGYFETTNAGNLHQTVHISHRGTGTALAASHTGASGNIAVFLSGSTTVVRIDKTGRGFFNGGTQVGGADVAELFEVEGTSEAYEPGDVLEISTANDRRVQKSSEPHSRRVIGVYATRPGVLLSEQLSTTDGNNAGRVPLGVIGVIPTKVSGENGAIQRGDLLVTARTPGHAMKAGEHPPVGSVIGKALAGFGAPGTGIIEVFVNVR